MVESALFWIYAVKSTIYLSFCHIWPAVTALWTINYCQAELGTFVKLKQEQLNKENWLKLIRFKWFLVLWASYLEHKVPFFPNMIKSRQNQISHSFENFFLFCEIFIQFIKRFFCVLRNSLANARKLKWINENDVPIIDALYGLLWPLTLNVFKRIYHIVQQLLLNHDAINVNRYVSAASSQASAAR